MITPQPFSLGVTNCHRVRSGGRLRAGSRIAPTAASVPNTSLRRSRDERAAASPASVRTTAAQNGPVRSQCAHRYHLPPPPPPYRNHRSALPPRLAGWQKRRGTAKPTASSTHYVVGDTTSIAEEIADRATRPQARTRAMGPTRAAPGVRRRRRPR